MYIHEICDKWDIDLSAISNQGKMEKRFDFVIKTDKMIYGIETNFYASGGSKLNETSRSYKQISQESETIDGFTFVWFTDGKGWNNARNNLEETFDIMDELYNIDDLEGGIIKTGYHEEVDRLRNAKTEKGLNFAKKNEINHQNLVVLKKNR